MQENYLAIMNNLKKKIACIISKYEQIREENTLIKQELDNIKHELTNCKTLNAALDSRLQKFQMAEAFKASSSDEKEAKSKINKLIKEIDKCMAMLNN